MLLALLLSFATSAHASPDPRCEKAAVDFIEMAYGMNVNPATSITTGADGKVALVFADTGRWIYIVTYTDETCATLDSHQHVEVQP